MAITEATREWLYRRSNQSAVPFYRLGIDSDASVFTVSVLIDGSEDEAFECTGPYEVNIADWIAEQLAEIKDAHNIHDWCVCVRRYTSEGTGDLVYGVTDEGVIQFATVDDEWEGLTT